MTVRKHFEFPAVWRQTDKWVWVPNDSGKGASRMSKDYLTLMLAARGILEQERPMTVRQIYYALFSQGFVHNSVRDYAQVIQAMVQGRQRGLIPWDWIEDRLRRPRQVGMWDDLADFLDAVKESYSKDVWATQDHYFEFVVEKDALSGIFQAVLDEYGVALNVARGYSSWSSIKNLAQRLNARKEEGKDITILYYGDFDPSGEDMPRSLLEGLAFFDCFPELKKLAITEEDIEEYDLPEEPGKTSDSRSAGFEEKHGKLIQVELDALPVRILRERIRESIESHIDMDALEQVREEQAEERQKLAELIESLEE